MNEQLLEEAFYADKGSDKALSATPKVDAVTLQAATVGADLNKLIKFLGNRTNLNILI